VAVRQITTGPTFTTPDNVSLTAVESGLKEAERVVTDGSDRLRDGLRVNVTMVDGKQVAPAAAPNGGGQGRNGGSGGGGQRGRRGGAGQ
jgi:membrane fusion protein, multidrug efflux system